MTQYEDELLEHDYDGIQEYNNPLPIWLHVGFWLLTAFSVFYVIYYGFNLGPSIQSDYEAQRRTDYAAVEEYYRLHPMQPPTALMLLAGAADPEVIGKGKAQFVKTCAPCHGEHAEGLIGPNLTDANWINGGKAVEIWTTIAKGVPAKGMPTWGRTFAPDVVAAMASYVRSLNGSNPPNPKPPQGDKVEMEPLPAPAKPAPTEGGK